MSEPETTDRRSESSERWHIPALDGVRSAAFLLVFISHSYFEHFGAFAVTVFFFLSGFLITTLLRRELKNSGSVSLRRFWQRRFVRILPPYFAVMAILIGLGLLTNFDYTRNVTAGAYLAYLTFTFNYYSLLGHVEFIVPGSSVYWSLAVEEHFYLLWPLAFLALARRSVRQTQQILFAACVVFLLWRVIVSNSGVLPAGWTYIATDARADSLLWGCLLAYFLDTDQNRAREIASSAARRWGLATLSALCLMTSFAIRNQYFRDTFRYSIQGAGLLAGFVLLVGAPTGKLLRLFSCKAAIWLAPLTYSAYLIHDGILKSLDRFGSRFGNEAQTVVGFALTIAAAVAIRRLIELPARRYSARFL
jgi:peptidoglycan/LPS O-acetylase OafA/YrhL